MAELIKWIWGKPLTKDSFLENGQLSTNEFTLAGDHLCFVCSGWKWSKSLNNHSCSDLDANKQFLIYERAICKRRIGELKEQQEETIKGQDGQDIIFLKKDETQKEEQVNEADIRYYTMYVVYDEYYHCPRMSFTATDIDGKPISNEQIREDIQKEYLDKTLTVEKFPFMEDVSMATVHPCKHSNVLKSMSDTMRENKQLVENRLALLIFMKFIASVIPHVEFDSVGDIHL